MRPKIARPKTRAQRWMYRLPMTRPVRASIVRRKMSRRCRVSPVTTQCDPRKSTFRTRRTPLRSAMRIASRRSTRRDLRSIRTPSRSIVRLWAIAGEAIGRAGSQTHKIARVAIKSGAVFIAPPIACRSCRYSTLCIRRWSLV